MCRLDKGELVMRVDRVSGAEVRPQEIHVDHSVRGYKVSILWGLFDVETVHGVFASIKQTREYIESRFGKNHGIPVLR